MSTNPSPYAGFGLKMQAATPVAGFALENATPTILSWTAPADGQLHRVMTFLTLHVTSAETGGVIQSAFFSPDGQSTTISQIAGSQAGGVYRAAAPFLVMIESGSLFTIAQGSALTAGAATLWAEIWAL